METEQSSAMAETLSRYGKADLVYGIGGDIEGYHSTCSKLINGVGRTLAWDRAFHNIELEDTWFFEFDVGFSPKVLECLLDKTKDIQDELICVRYKNARLKECDDYEISLKKHCPEIEKRLWSNNVFCRMKPSLIQKILDFRERNNGFIFHEIMFPTLADSVYDLEKETELIKPKCVKWRPVLSPNIKGDEFTFYHPVKYRDLWFRIHEQ